MNLPNVYEKHLLIEPHRLVLLSPEETVNTELFKRGILFILAIWSGASQLAFRALNRALASMQNLDDLCLYVADTDSDKTQEFYSAIGDVPSGHGETYWFLDGQVQHKLRGYSDESLLKLQEYTKDILFKELRPST